MTLHSQRFATETLIRLSEKIPNVEIILEYSVKPYRIDAYLPAYNIAIEIDENDHQSYDAEKEFERSKFITSTLHCSWIRVNNSDTIENTVEQLLKQLKYYGISATTEITITDTAKEPQNKSYTQQLKEFKANLAEEAAKAELERLQQIEMAQKLTFADVFEVTKCSQDFLSYKDIEQAFKQLGHKFEKKSIREYCVRDHHLEFKLVRINCHTARWFFGIKFKDPALADMIIKRHSLLTRN